MRIIYITTSLEANDYNEFNKMWSVSLNPSNQNFHNKVIRALAINNKVDVISIRPFSRGKCRLKELGAYGRTVGNISYHYLKIRRGNLFRMISIRSQVKKLIDAIKSEDSLIYTDTINPKCIAVTNYIQKKFKIPAIGICTDSPSNITGTTRSYTMYLLKGASKLDGFVTLTESLNMLYNQNNKKHITIEGIVESNPEINEGKVEGQYIFFGGALLPRYGVYELIEAFKQIEKKDISLIVCGHHADERRIYEAIGQDVRIKYLGTLPVKDVLTFEKYAVANINPRPFTQDLDRLSIPSKTLEYLASGTLTISTKNTELEKVFKDCAIWAKSSEVKDIKEALNKVINMEEKERLELAKKAKTIAISRYSIENVAELLDDFSKNFLQ